LIDQDGIASPIAIRLKVLAAIDFGNELSLKADEIEDVVLQGHLAAKLEPGKPTMAQESPHCRFGIRRVAPQLARVAAFALCERTMVETGRH